jgi:hypothetical protein
VIKFSETHNYLFSAYHLHIMDIFHEQLNLRKGKIFHLLLILTFVAYEVENKMMNAKKKKVNKKNKIVVELFLSKEK